MPNSYFRTPMENNPQQLDLNKMNLDQETKPEEESPWTVYVNQSAKKAKLEQDAWKMLKNATSMLKMIVSTLPPPGCPDEESFRVTMKETLEEL